MKKILLLLITITTAFNLAAQQACVPGTLTAPQDGYVLPDSATGLSHACAGMFYDQVIYIKAPADTMVTFQSIPITADVDSFVVDANIAGLPSYLTVETVPGLTQPNPPNPKSDFERLIIPGDSLACVRISGMVPTTQGPGPIPLTINIRAYFSGIPIVGTLDTPASVGYYEIVVDAPNTGVCFPSSVNDLSDLLTSVELSPNPAQDYFNLKLESKAREVVSIKLLDFSGRIVYENDLNLNIGNNHLDIASGNLARGTYLLHISNSSLHLSRKVQLR